MAHAKHTPHSHREKARSLGTSPVPETGPQPQAPFLDGEPKSGPGARISFIVWFFGFLFLSVLVLWDLVAAVIETIVKKLT